jgi:hypothetical protein
VFLSTRHEWNHDQLDAILDGHSAGAYAGWRVPENELFELLHVLRRKLVVCLRERASYSELDSVMDRVLRVSASTGSMDVAGSNDELGRWAYVAGERSRGRFARHSIRNGTSSAAAAETIPNASNLESGVLRDVQNTEEVVGAGYSEPIIAMDDDGQLAVEVDVQMMQLTLKASHPQALPADVAQLPDVKDVFGDVSMQACLTEQTAARSIYRIVGYGERGEPQGR